MSITQPPSGPSHFPPSGPSHFPPSIFATYNVSEKLFNILLPYVEEFRSFFDDYANFFLQELDACSLSYGELVICYEETCNWFNKIHPNRDNSTVFSIAYTMLISNNPYYK